jgi:galactose mutarotase-like enzyme
LNYEIKNNSISAKIDSFGAQLNSLKKNNQNIEYIWQANAEYWNRHSPILFPIVGRLKDDIYFYKDKKYNMRQHGFARDCEFELIRKDDDFLNFRLKNTDKSLEIYPFLFELDISYELIENKLIISYEVKNMTNGEIFFSIGAHPAFNWPLENEKKEDSFLEFINIKSTKRYFLNDKGLVYKSDNLEIEDNKIALNEELFKDDALIFNDPNIKQVTFKNLKNKNYVKLDFENFPYLGIWSKPSGAPFICIEPWFGIADEINTTQNFEDKRGIISLQKDEIFSCFYSVEI